MAKLRYALVGAGRRGISRIRNASRMSDWYDIVAVCDMNPEVANSFAKEYGARAYTSVRELVDKEHLDVVDVNTPAAAHHAVSGFFAGAGLNVITCCPVALTVPTADLMLDAARRGGAKFEVCETIYRQPNNRFVAEVVNSGAIGDVIRVYGIFAEPLYHGLSLIRCLIGSEPTSFRTISYTHPVKEFQHKKSRAGRHTAEEWHTSFVDFASGAMAIQIYSNVIHARGLGRQKDGFFQVDGTEGAIHNEEVMVVPPEFVDSGAAVSYPFKRVTAQIEGETVVQRMEVELPNRTIAWENPLKELPIPEADYRECEQLWTFAEAVNTAGDPEYSNDLARQDLEMSIAVLESARLGGERVDLPITGLTPTEAKMHEDFKNEFGLPVEDMDGLLDVFYPQTFSMIDLLPGESWSGG